MDPRFELFDHTADLGIRVVADTPAGLIAPATEALYAVIGELAASGPAETMKLELHGEDTAILLRDYLAELLRLFETAQRMITGPRVEAFGPGLLRVTGLALRVDPERCIYYREVKAVTYHELALREIEGGCEAVVIVDI
jgi:SHS2 domain-containing protein